MKNYAVHSKPGNQALADFLNYHAAQGWRFIQYVTGEGYIFEREANSGMRDDSKPTTILVRPDHRDAAMKLLESDDEAVKPKRKRK